MNQSARRFGSHHFNDEPIALSLSVIVSLTIPTIISMIIILTIDLRVFPSFLVKPLKNCALLLLQFVCMGGTPKRMEHFANYIMKEIGHKLPAGTTLLDITKNSYRYSMFKVGPVLSISVSLSCLERFLDAEHSFPLITTLFVD